MQEIRRRRVSIVDLRARLPRVTRAVALMIGVAGVLFVGLSYYKLRNNVPFRMFGQNPELSRTVTSVVEGYERREMDGDRLSLLVRAARDITFADGHHELEEVQLESYPEGSDKPNQVKARRAIFDQQKGSVMFTGDVNIEMRDGLVAKTESVTYDIKSETAETAVLLNFTRANLTGVSTGAVVDAKNKTLVLRSAVEVTVNPEAQPGAQPAKGSRARPVTIRAMRATYDEKSLHLAFMGGATAEQGQDIMSGDVISANLNDKRRLQKIEARGHSYLRSMTEGRAAEAHARDMDFFLDNDQQLTQAVGMNEVSARSLDADSEAQLNGSNKLTVNFEAQGERSLLKEMRAEGRSVLTLSAPKSRANDPKAANKRLTADAVNLFWRSKGKDLERAEAIGNAELVIEPVQATPAADRKTLTAPRFDGDFYETGNLARNFTATGGVKAVFDPVQPSETRAQRTLTAQKMTAAFVRETQDINQMDASGDAKFNEQDRNGRSQTMTYTASDETVRMRGGEPTVWDSRARTKAQEIDSDTRSDISYCRGKTATTYYSQEQTGGATPFSKVKNPVYIVSDRAEFRHTTGVAIYTGNARAWQDDNFVRGDTITLYRENKRMESQGNVQSALYQARRKEQDGSRSVVPVFATSDRMTYSDTDRIVHYEGNVDVKQGTERITSAVTDVYLLKDTNEMEKSVAQRDVVLTQPGRRGTGDWAQYTAADETVVLKGAPARVEDAENGTNEAGRLTVYLRDSRVIADTSNGTQSTGRVRSKHPIKKE
ncbi:MAG TPA: LPS export ABC transporter periplasmic protein LptC [Pyrinomonadaceae bacterium]|jgi:LPS export ABC transporter protein LptC